MQFSQLRLVSKRSLSCLDLAMLHAVIGLAGGMPARSSNSPAIGKTRQPWSNSNWRRELSVADDVPASSGVRICIFWESISAPNVDEGTDERSALRKRKDIVTIWAARHRLVQIAIFFSLPLTLSRRGALDGCRCRVVGNNEQSNRPGHSHGDASAPQRRFIPTTLTFRHSQSLRLRDGVIALASRCQPIPAASLSDDRGP
jgi:hypothetical protein